MTRRPTRTLRVLLCGTVLAAAAGLRLPALVTSLAEALHVEPSAPLVDPAPAQPNPATYPSELVEQAGHTRPELIKSKLPHTYLRTEELPESFSWGDINGVSYLTRALNQHVPQCTCCAPGAPLAAGGLAARRAPRL